MMRAALSSYAQRTIRAERAMARLRFPSTPDRRALIMSLLTATTWWSHRRASAANRSAAAAVGTDLWDAHRYGWHSGDTTLLLEAYT